MRKRRPTPPIDSTLEGIMGTKEPIMEQTQQGITRGIGREAVGEVIEAMSRDLALAISMIQTRGTSTGEPHSYSGVAVVGGGILTKSMIVISTTESALVTQLSLRRPDRGLTKGGAEELNPPETNSMSGSHTRMIKTQMDTDMNWKKKKSMRNTLLEADTTSISFPQKSTLTSNLLPTLLSKTQIAEGRLANWMPQYLSS
jgi:hypothetical protein